MSQGGFDMLIVRFEQHVHIRLGEWFAAFIELSLGIFLFAIPGFFESEDLFAVMRHMAHQNVWATASFLMGSIRIGALYVNGRKSITPYIRMTFSFLSCLVWWSFLLGVIASGRPALSLVFLPWLLVLDMYNVYRATRDAREVFDKKRALVHGTGKA